MSVRINNKDRLVLPRFSDAMDFTRSFFESINYSKKFHKRNCELQKVSFFELTICITRICLTSLGKIPI